MGTLSRSLVFCVGAILLGGVALARPNCASAEPLRIMPLGDSITAGNDNFNQTPGGYRTTLWELLRGGGYDFDFVGSQNSNPGPIPSNAHEGHGGYTIEQLRQTVGPSVVANQPDVILLLAGTNDVTWSVYITPTLTAADIAGRLNVLLSDLYFHRPNATVFVGTIPPAAAGAHSTRSAEVNALFPGVLATHAAQGRSVHLVDLRALLTPADLADSLHPSPAGYAKLGQAWFEAIVSVIPPPPPPPLMGDVNGDGAVNVFDINLVAAHWSEAGPVGDANADGVVNIFDVNLISAHWTPTGGQANVSPVPEPSTLGLAIAAAVGGGLTAGRTARSVRLRARKNTAARDPRRAV